MELGPRFREALLFALDLHRGQTKKGGEVPYASHLLSVASLVLHFGGSEEQAIAALLHDGPEDQGGRRVLEVIGRRFGTAVADIVDACTDTYDAPKPPWRPRKEAWLGRIPALPREALLVAACDKLDNARAILADLRSLGPRVWERFAGGRDSIWYYRAAAEALRRAGAGPACDELDAAVRAIERLDARRGPGG